MVSKKNKKFVFGLFMFLISAVALSVVIFNNIIKAYDFLIARGSLILHLIISFILSASYLGIATIQEGKLSLRL